MTRKELLEQLEEQGFQTRVLPNGINILVYTGTNWFLIEDDIQEVPLDLLDSDVLYNLISLYAQTPLTSRKVIQAGSTHRIVDAVYDIRELGLSVSFQDTRLVIYLDDVWYMQIKPAVSVWVRSQYLERLNQTVRQSLVDIVYKLLVTAVPIRFWEYTETEQEYIRECPGAQWVTRDPISGGIDIHTERPVYLDNQFYTKETYHIPYEQELFLKINYSQEPYRV